MIARAWVCVCELWGKFVHVLCVYMCAFFFLVYPRISVCVLVYVRVGLCACWYMCARVSVMHEAMSVLVHIEATH